MTDDENLVGSSQAFVKPETMLERPFWPTFVESDLIKIIRKSTKNRFAEIREKRETYGAIYFYEENNDRKRGK